MQILDLTMSFLLSWLEQHCSGLLSAGAEFGVFLNSLGINATTLLDAVCIAVLYSILRRVYFLPFQKLIHARRRKTVEDALAAEKIRAEAEARQLQYQEKVAQERAELRAMYDLAKRQSQDQETDVIARARDEAKKIAQHASEAAAHEREALLTQMGSEVDVLAEHVAAQLVSGLS